MFRLSLRNVWSRKGRLVITAIAVVAGTAFLNGVFVLTGTIRQSLSQVFADAYADTDAFVRSARVIEGDFGEEARDRVPVSIVDTVRSAEGVLEADGYVTGVAVVTFEGTPLGVDGPPKFGASWVGGEVSPWDIDEGEPPVEPDDVVIDRASARFGGVEIGDTVTITAATGSRDFTVVGIATFAGADSFGGVNWSFFELSVAQQLLTGATDALDAVLVAGDDGVDEVVLADSIASVVGDPEVEVLTGTEITEESQSAIQRALGFITIFLSVFALISLFVGSFIIFNVFSISAAQRQRENALLRAIGATRGQVTRSLFVEAAVVGFSGSLVGATAGVGLAWALLALLNAIGFGPGSTDLVVGVQGFVGTMLVGIGVTLACALVPALRAGRVPPLAAMRDVAVDRSAASRRRLVIGGIALALGVLSVAGGFSGSSMLLGLGVALVFISMVIVGPFIAAPVARSTSPVLTRLRGAAGTMSARNAARNPKRTAVTAMALAVGLSLMIAVATLGASAKASARVIIGEAFTADYVVSEKLQSGFGLPTAVADALDGAGVGDAVGFAGAQLQLNEQDDSGTRDWKAKAVIAVSPQNAAAVLELGFVDGGFGDLTREGILYASDKAERDGLSLGDTVRAKLLDGTELDLTVQGIYSDDTFGNLMVDRALFDGQAFPLFDFAVFARTEGGVSPENTAALQAVLDDYPSAKLQSRDEFIDAQDDQVDGFLNFIYGLLGMSIFIAVIGIVITLWLAVYERRRELGLLRAVGMTRKQVRTSVLWESLITGAVGVVFGLVLGTSLGWIIVRSFRDEGLREFALPASTIATASIAVLVFAALAAFLPARKAAKSDMLDAIATT
ncbi:MAG: ABC transporter permease [Ilumatobacteraceae bacterium]